MQIFDHQEFAKYFQQDLLLHEQLIQLKKTQQWPDSNNVSCPGKKEIS